ncbi:MAG: sigma-54 dependent transcriptional regulator, partial [Rhodospirillales bacterium]|nr:sigma-54 dependent transcriptional regulator [Rhodospirillales bacterium]
LSDRKGKPFISINCGAIPENLLESELFGHVKGAFTGAVASKIGKFEAADGGTLLLDEIGEMPLTLQVKLLRVIQERAIEKVGEIKQRAVDIRIVSATNKDLDAEVKAGRFREDLYYRLNVASIDVPPLRARRDDILPLAQHFHAEAAAMMSLSTTNLLSESVDLLKAYPWPGNVRELRNVIERALILAGTRPIGPEHLPKELQSGTEGAPLATGESENAGILTLAEAERRHIIRVLAECGGNKTLAAKRLKISRSTLRNRLREDVPDESGTD